MQIVDIIPDCSCYSNSKCGFQPVIAVASPQPIVTILPPSKLNCLSGSTVTLTATATGGSGGYTYQWYTGTPPSGAPISGATSSTYNANTVGSYYVVVTTSKGCQDTSEPVTVEHTPNPTVSITSPTLELNCKVSTITLTATASSGEAPYTYKWFKDGSEISGQTSSTWTLQLLDV